MYDINGYYNAPTLESAIEKLTQHPEAKIICGGSDVLIRIREGALAGCTLVCVRDIPELQGISLEKNGDISIGAATPFSHVTANPIIQAHIPVLGEAVDQVGGPQIRNIGTIGGNLCNGAVSADSAPACFCLEAVLQTASPAGGREIPIEAFYLGPGRVALEPGEILTRIVIPRAHYAGFSGHYIKYAMRNAMDIATLSCCALARMDGSRIAGARIAFGVAAPTPLRCRETEARICGMAPGAALWEAVESGVRGEITPRDSWRASRAFRLQIGGEIARRALEKAIENGGER